jgi:hypothetical protein
MDFMINKNSTLPLLKLDVIQDGRYDVKQIYELIQNSNMYFSMSDLETGVKVIGKKPALCFPKPSDCGYDEYYIGYKFSEKETKKPGTYVGQFTIEFLDGYGTLIMPIKEELFIHVLEGSIKK